MIVWVDLETTGLDPRNCAIIEVACVVTDDAFNQIATYEAIVKPSNSAVIDSYALEMHKKSGLWDEVQKSDRTVGEVDRQLTYLLKEVVTGPLPPLGGQSVHFDRAFMENWMPLVTTKWNHRNFDVSSIKMLFVGALEKTSDELPPIKSLTAHRAMDDIQDSIEAARFYRKKIRMGLILR